MSTHLLAAFLLITVVWLTFRPCAAERDEWTVSGYEYDMRTIANLHRLNSTHVLAVGNNYTHAIVTSIINSDGRVVESNAYETKNMIKVCGSVLAEDGTLAVLGHAARQFSMYIAKFRSYKLDLLWTRTYGYASDDDYSAMRVRTGSGRMKYVLLVWGENENTATLSEINGDSGEILWEKKMFTMLNMCTLGETKGDGIVYSLYEHINSATGYASTIVRLGPDKNVKTEARFMGVHVRQILETADGVVVVGSTNSNTTIDEDNCYGEVMFLENDMSLRWKLPIPGILINSNARIIESVTGDYILLATTGLGLDLKVIVVEVLRNGTVGWTRSCKQYAKGWAIIELRPREYVALMSDSQSSGTYYVSKFTVPSDAELLPFGDLINYKNCPLGLYWNGTRCIPCFLNCLRCRMYSPCLECASGYTWTEPTRTCVRTSVPAPRKPTVCDCSLPAESLSPECRTSCTPAGPIYCALRESSISTFKVPDCVCPSESVDNGTHCVRTMTQSCPALCAVCTMGAPNSWYEIYCVQCAALPNVITYRTARHVVDCQCRVGYILNGSICEHPKRKEAVSATDDQSNIKILPLFLEVAGLVLTILTVIVVMVRRRRRQGQNLGVPQTDDSVSQTTTKSAVELRPVVPADK